MIYMIVLSLLLDLPETVYCSITSSYAIQGSDFSGPGSGKFRVGRLL